MSFEAFAEKIDQEAAIHLAKIAKQAERIAITSMSVGPEPGPEYGWPAVQTGMLRANIASDRPRVRRGKISCRFGVLKTEDEGESLKYALFLELGTRHMAPRPWLTLTLEQLVRQGLMDAFQSELRF